MSPIRCPYCGAEDTEAAACEDGPIVCQSCGKAVELPAPGAACPEAGRDDRRWSAGPPEESARRWSDVAPPGDDESSSSISVSQSSILPRGEAPREDGSAQVSERHADNPYATALARRVRSPRSPLIWLLLVAALFLAALIAAAILARRFALW